MKLIETDGKTLLRTAGIQVPEGFFLPFDQQDVTDQDIVFPVFVKAQVLEGRRGQRGLVRRCESKDQFFEILNELRQAIGSTPCAGFLCESAVEHATEMLAAFDIDSVSGQIRLSLSEEGGMKVAKVKSFFIQTEHDIDSLEFSSSIKDTLKKMFRLFVESDLLNLEINPLAILVDGSCIALDAKVETDDAAAFRHPEWSSFTSLKKLSSREAAYASLLEQAGHRGTLGRYVELDGDIALILSGGGASLVAIDALKLAGGKPANYVEMSGNPDPEIVREASKFVLSKPGIKAIWIAGSFANFTDIQATVNAVLSAVSDLGLKVPVVIRRDGPNAEAAKRDAEEWGKAHGIPVRFDRADIDLDASARAVVEAASV